MAHLQEKIHGIENSGSSGLQIVLHMCPVSNSTLAESRQYYLLSLRAIHIRVMPDERLDVVGHILLLLGAELPLVVESFGLLNDIFPFSSILDTGYPVFNLHLANILFDVI